MPTSHYLPPHALDAWVIAASRALGLEPSTEATPTILNMARDVAHNVARPAAPVSAFLLGLAVAQSASPGSTLEHLSQRLVELASEWETDSSGGEQITDE